MAFSVGNGATGGHRGRRFGSPATMSEINIVPLVDVVLVLLIIFMITANVMEFGLDIQVPQVRRVQNTAQDLPVISITKNGTSYLNEKPVNINLLADAVRQRFHNATAVYIRADKEATWDVIAQIIAELGEAKFEVKMVTAPTDEAARQLGVRAGRRMAEPLDILDQRDPFGAPLSVPFSFTALYRDALLRLVLDESQSSNSRRHQSGRWSRVCSFAGPHDPHSAARCAPNPVANDTQSMVPPRLPSRMSRRSLRCSTKTPSRSPTNSSVKPSAPRNSSSISSPRRRIRSRAASARQSPIPCTPRKADRGKSASVLTVRWARWVSAGTPI